MISVIILFQPVDHLLLRYVSSHGKSFDVFRHLRQQFVFGYATDAGIIVIHGYVGDVVKLTEDAHLREPGDARKEDKAQLCFAIF